MFNILTCLAFWLLITCPLLVSIDLFCTDEGKSMLVRNIKVIEILWRYEFLNKPMSYACCFQTRTLSSGLLTSFCKAERWLIAIAAADCHPLGLKPQVPLWCGGSDFLAGERLLRGGSSVKWNMSDTICGHGHPDPKCIPQKNAGDIVLQIGTSN